MNLSCTNTDLLTVHPLCRTKNYTEARLELTSDIFNNAVVQFGHRKKKQPGSLQSSSFRS